MIRNYILIGMAFLLVFGCLNLDIDVTPEDGGNQNQTITLDPSFSILHPSAVSAVESSAETTDVEVLLNIKDITLKAPSEENFFGEGHFVLTLDNEKIETIASTSYVFEDVALGEHTLVVEFVNNDGSSYDPEISKSLSFTVALKEGVHLGPEEHPVVLTSQGFEPQAVEMIAGDILVITNEDFVPHAVSIVNSDTKKSLKTLPTIQPGESFSYAIENPGNYGFSSTTNPSLKGTIVVLE